MSDVIDIFSKKKVKRSANDQFYQRFMGCLKEIEKNGKCECDVCLTKQEMSQKLFNVLMFLCQDHKDNTGVDLYYPDALEISLIVAELIKREIGK